MIYKLKPDLPFLKLLVPLIQNVDGVCDVHPNIAYAKGNASNENKVPEFGLAGEAEHTGDDAEEVEDGIPIANAHWRISSLLDVHSVLENRGEEVVCGEFGVEAIALRDDIRHHSHYLQTEKRAN